MKKIKSYSSNIATFSSPTIFTMSVFTPTVALVETGDLSMCVQAFMGVPRLCVCMSGENGGGEVVEWQGCCLP